MSTPLTKKIAPYLADLIDRQITGREVARILGVSESYVSRALKALNVVRRQPARKEAQLLRQARLAHRIKAATTMSVHDAAKACDVHPRTITRLLATLEQKK